MSEGEKFDCEKCTPRDKQARGCDGKRKWRVGSGYVWGCPQKLITVDVQQAVELWGRWKRFGWPYAGGWAEQPARYFDTVEAVENEALAVQARRMEKTQHGHGH